MKNTYIPIEVNKQNKVKTWYLDVTLNGVSVSCLDAIIYDRTCSSAFMHQIRKERKQTGKRKIQKKIRRR